MMFRLAAGCLVVGALVFLSPERQGPLAPTLPSAAPLASAIGRNLVGQGEPPGGPAEAARTALTDLIVEQAVAAGTARLHGALAAVLPGASERPRSLDTLKPEDRLPPWRGTMPRS
jgi:hypothetical protein